MVIVIDGDVTAARKRRNTDVQTMQELICTQVVNEYITVAWFPDKHAPCMQAWSVLATY